jgi:hypothetical protein
VICVLFFFFFFGFFGPRKIICMSCTGFFWSPSRKNLPKEKGFAHLLGNYNEYVAINTLVCILGYKYKLLWSPSRYILSTSVWLVLGTDEQTLAIIRAVLTIVHNFGAQKIKESLVMHHHGSQ